MRALVPMALAALWSAPTSASTFVAMDLAELVANSDAVVRARVVNVESSWHPSGKVIVTDADIEVSETILGERAPSFRVRTFGGQVEDYVIEAHGFPTFEKGQRVVLFLQRHEDDTIRVTGYQLGHYRVVERGGMQVAVPTLEGDVGLFDRTGARAVRPQSVPLDQFVSDLHQIAQRGATR